MAVVRLRAPLSELAGGCRELELEGDTVAEVLRAREQAQPPETAPAPDASQAREQAESTEKAPAPDA